MKTTETGIEKWRTRLAMRAYINAQPTAFARLRAKMHFRHRPPPQRWRPVRLVINNINPRRTIERFIIRRFVQVTGIRALPINVLNVVNRKALFA